MRSVAGGIYGMPDYLFPPSLNRTECLGEEGKKGKLDENVS